MNLIDLLSAADAFDTTVYPMSLSLTAMQMPRSTRQSQARMLSSVIQEALCIIEDAERDEIFKGQ
jgi:hypothetical protein